MGDYACAIDYQQQSLTIAREIGDRYGEGTALGNLGIQFYSKGILSPIWGNNSKIAYYQEQSNQTLKWRSDRREVL